MSNNKFKFLTILCALLVSSFAFAEEVTVKEIAVSVDVFVPGNIKSTDDAYVVINGLFPNSCYTLDRVEVNHSGPFNHQVKTIAKVRSGICLRVYVPFNKHVSLGALKAGDHQLRFVADDDTYSEKIMSVK